MTRSSVPISYESRIAKLSLNEAELPKVDSEFEEITEGEEEGRKQKLKTKWAALEALVGSEKRIRLIAEDLVQHFERRLEATDGKAMVVCMSRRICVDLYNELIKLRPDWDSAQDDDIEAEKKRSNVVKIVMTGSADDGVDWQPHIRSKLRRKALTTRFKDTKDPFRIVIVRDMWLTGFDAPCLRTMYADKPMRGHGLMQAIARVNRVFRDKQGGLIVDYLGLADQLKQALATYTESGGQGSRIIDTAQAVAVLLKKYEVCCDLMHGFDWSKWMTGTSYCTSDSPWKGFHFFAVGSMRNRYGRGCAIKRCRDSSCSLVGADCRDSCSARSPCFVYSVASSPAVASS